MYPSVEVFFLLLRTPNAWQVIKTNHSQLNRKIQRVRMLRGGAGKIKEKNR